MALSTTERNAFAKAISLQGAASVCRLARGRYIVPSATSNVLYTITGTALDGSDFQCTCEAQKHGRFCWHKAAVVLRRTQENALHQARKLHQPRPAA
jgi:uncharacterized Zn finger protein